jgi:hypothetical protein
MPYDFFIYQYLLQGEHRKKKNKVKEYQESVSLTGKERMGRLFPVKRKRLTLTRSFTEERKQSVSSHQQRSI